MIRWATDRIAVGGVHDALDWQGLLRDDITGVISLDWFPLVAPTTQLLWLRRPPVDGRGNSIQALMDALEALDSLLASCPRVLVHCREGVSRSPFVTACHLSRESGGSFLDVLPALSARLGFVLINKGLIELAAEWEARFIPSILRTDTDLSKPKCSPD